VNNCLFIGFLCIGLSDYCSLCFSSKQVLRTDARQGAWCVSTLYSVVVAWGYAKERGWGQLTFPCTMKGKIGVAYPLLAEDK
jgi:hypothetical protein